MYRPRYDENLCSCAGVLCVFLCFENGENCEEERILSRKTGGGGAEVFILNRTGARKWDQVRWIVMGSVELRRKAQK